MPALLIGCNAILDNPEGELVAAGGTGVAAGGSAVGGKSGTAQSSSAGNTALGGGTASGGSSSAVGGSQPSVGGTSATLTSGFGGNSNLGGAPGTGGSLPAGGAVATGGNGLGSGGANLGGSDAQGGVGLTGGTTGTSVTPSGGATPVGGSFGSGGALTSGGAPASGGSAAGGDGAGGTPATGGAAAGGAGVTGGAATGGLAPTGGASTGGAPVTGGAPATGGSSSIVGPSVVFSYASVNEAASTNLTTATFQFSSTPAGAATAFKCKFNSAAAFTDCTSGLALSQLSSGGQVLTVHAVDSLGHVGPDATRTWTITPLATTIKTIRKDSFDDYLVSLSTGVRVTGFGTESSQQVIFVQEAGPASSVTVDGLSDISGSPVLNAGMLTRALTTQAVKPEGTPVTVIGTVTRNGSSLEIARATYIWGTGAAVPYNVPTIRTSTVYSSELEAVRIALAGRIPSSNCSSSCFNSLIGNSNICIETSCSDSGCPTNKILAWLDVTGGTSPPVTTGYGVWQGWLVKRNAFYELWTNGSDEYGDDVCM